ncbi:MAG: LysM peptidoglycan-binding domain-containing protein [Firmicutes bacterium]|jgi:nucleoid-associated protein YgaU|nr:LysM peptidoglycan-binding domain-containing protein [Bacillota bacterium]
MAADTWYHQGPEMSQLPPGKEPRLGQAVGPSEKEPLGIFLSLEAADLIGRHLMSEPNKEGGGVLLGYVAQSNRPFILISGAIEARYAEVVGGSIGFNERSWDYMHTLWRRDYPHTLVIGCFLSHPNRGVGLTSYDRFTQHRFFNHPWQVALAVDTVQNVSQFYRWQGRELHPVEGFVIWDSRKEPLNSLLDLQGPFYGSGWQRRSEAESRKRTYSFVPGQAPRESEIKQSSEIKKIEAPKPKRPRSEPRSETAIFGFWPMLLIALLFFLMLWPRFPWSLTHLWSSGTQRQQELQELQETLREIQQEPEPESEPERESGEPAVMDVEDISGSPSQPAPPSASQSSSLNTVSSGTISATTYRVQPGDTLWEISKKLMGDPREYRRLAAINQIEDPALIHPGTDLTYPDPGDHGEARAIFNSSSEPTRVSGQ